MWWKYFGSACLLAAVAVTARAEDGSAYIVTGHDAPAPAQSTDVRVSPYRHESLVIHPMNQPAAPDSREFFDRPTRPWLVEFKQAAGKPIFLDLDADYQHQGDYSIDSNNSILAAQRIARSLMAPGAYIVHGQPDLADQPPIRPRLIILKPTILDKSAPNPMLITPGNPLIPDSPPLIPDPHPSTKQVAQAN